MFDAFRFLTSIVFVGCLSTYSLYAAPLTPNDLGNASYIERATAGPLNQEGFLPNTPELIQLDYLTSGGSQAVSSVIASPLGPQADIQFSVYREQGDSSAPSGFAAGGDIRVTYGIAVVPRVSDAPNAPVRLAIKIMMSMSVSQPDGITGNFSTGGASVLVDGIDWGTGTSRLSWGVASGPNSFGYPTSVTDSRVFLGLFPVNTVIGVEKQIAIGGGGNRSGNYEGIGVVDPQFSIDPTFLVNYNGNPTPASDLYEIIYSPGVVPVPEPSMAAIGGAVGLLVLRRPRRA